jgi:hypothetical protein
MKSFIYQAWNHRVPMHFPAAVSLHSHTSRSRETMSFIPRYVENIPYLWHRIRSLESSYRVHHGEAFDYSRVWWNPPLEPKAAFDLERAQIEALGCEAMVSLTDHDCVEAGVALELFPDAAGAPVSTEWTVHTGQSFLHLGVHNLQPARARMLMSEMQIVTAAKDPARTAGMLDELTRDPGTLVVVNHPLWDEAKVGGGHHRVELAAFIQRFRPYLHALELNGLRSADENAAVLQMAEETGLPVVGGGDRHGCEPNALINLTRARNFSEFVEEVRDGAPTHTAYMPQYKRSLAVRVVELMSDVLRNYDSFNEGRKLWSDRVFYASPDGTVKRLSDVWTGNGPCVIGQFVSGIQFLRRHLPGRHALDRAIIGGNDARRVLHGFLSRD